MGRRRRPTTPHIRPSLSYVAAAPTSGPVNFDTFIERSATTPLRLTCWPASPGDPGEAELLKPHGTLGGRLAVTPDEVLAPIEPAWLQRFRADIDASTTIILLGYSGRDYDFHTEWDNAVTGQDVLWFDFPDRGDGDRDRMRRLFGGADSAGRLSFPPPTPQLSPTGDTVFNPCWDFIAWCRDRDLVDTVTASQMTALLDDHRADTTYPRLTGNRRRARAEIATLLNARGQALRNRAVWALKGPDRRAAVAAILRAALTRPSTPARFLTSGWRHMPRAQRLSDIRARLRQAWLAQLSDAARHEQIVRETEPSRGPIVAPNEWALRTAALKMTGAVDDSIAEARRVVESHDPPTDSAINATACFHWCHGLLWRGRYQEAQHVLDTHLRPAATIANARWMAWTDYVAACIQVGDDTVADMANALAWAGSAAERFSAEGNTNGRITALTVELTALRKAGRENDYRCAAQRLLTLIRRRPPFARQAVLLEYSQGLAQFDNDLGAARKTIEGFSDSPFLVHRALATVLWGQWQPTITASDHWLTQARTIAADGGLELLERVTDSVLSTSFDDRRHVAFYYP